MSKVRSLNVVIAVAVVAFIVLRSHPDELWAALREMDFRLAVLAFLLNVPVALLAPLRSFFLFRRLGFRVSARVLVPTTILGFVAGGLTPAAAGELVRARALRAAAGVPFEDSITVVLYERVLAAYLLALTTAVLFALTRLSATWSPLVLGAGVALGCLPWAVGLTLGSLAPLGTRFPGAGLRVSLIRGGFQMAKQLRFLLEQFSLLIQWSLVTITMFALISLQYWLLAGAVAGGIRWDEAWIALGVSTLAAVASLLPLGLGVLDGTLAAVLARLGSTLAQGSIVAVSVRATVTLPLLLAAFVCYLYLQRSDATDQVAASSDP